MSKLVQIFQKLGITNDKVMHFIVGLTISVLVGLFFANALYGMLAGVLAGVGKEIYDYCDYGLFDQYDMLATWCGALLGYSVVVLL